MLPLFMMFSFADPSAVWISSTGEVQVEQTESGAEATAKETKRTPRSGSIPTISLELEDADIHGVIRLFADLTGKNFVLDDSVQGKLTLVK